MACVTQRYDARIAAPGDTFYTYLCNSGYNESALITLDCELDLD